MKLFLKTFLAIFIISNAFTQINPQINAQVNAPKLRCATTRFNGDVVLTWQLPVVTCGVNGYNIWAQPAGGAYSLLANIPNTAQTSFTHIGANGNNSQWFYYLVTNANCAGQPVLHSDTLDNRPPTPPVINHVSVINGQVVLAWNPGIDPETHSYIVYNATTNVAIDTVFGRNNTQFTDVSANGNTSIYSYTLVTMDTCFNAGIINVFPQHNIVLNTAIDRCTQSANLTWNAYDNWENGVKEYQIWSSVNGAAEAPIDTVAGSVLQYTSGNLIDGANTCFTVRAIAAGTGYTAVSNANCVTINIVKPARFIYVKNVTINPDSSVGIDWQWNTDIDLASFGLNSSEDNTMYQRFSVITAQLPLVTSNHTDIAFQAIDKNRVFYKIESIDSCQHSFFSNYAATVFASVMPLDNFTNKITWTAYDNLLGRVQYYDVFKKTANGAVKIATATANSLQTEEKLNPSVEENQDACYYVVAYANVRLPPNNTPFNVTSRSNTVCAHQTISLAMPNAFAPEGTNSVFKPAAVFTKTTNYSMQIYDRWGGIVFQSNDIDTGWDGSINGKPCPQGVYVYVIKAQETNKKNIEKRGSVMLLR